MSFINDGECDRALAIIDPLLADNPGNLQALFLKAEALRRSGNAESAEHVLNVVSELLPSNAEVLFRLGLARLDVGKTADAEEVLAKAAQQLPDNPQVWFWLGMAALRQDRLREAEAAFRAAVDRDGSFALALSNLAICLGRQGRPEDATPLLERALDLAPDRQDIAGLLLQAYIDLSDHASAERFAASMARRFPENDRWFALHGWVLRHLGRAPEAVEAYRQAGKLRPDSAEYSANLGMALREVGAPDEARQALARAAELDPDSMEAHLGLANLHLDADRLEDAARVVEDFDTRTHHPRGAARSVVIPVLDYSPGSAYDIRTLLDDLADFDGEVICIFNSDTVFDDLRGHPRIDKFAYNKHNVGVSRAWNMGINQAEGATIHILNADLHVSVPMLSRMEQWLHSLPDALCVGVSAHWMDPLTLRETRALNTGAFAQPIEADTVSGQLFSLHSRRLHDAGITFDPRLSPYFGEEVDLALKARQNGLKIYAVPETDFDHTWGISRKDRPIRFFGRPVQRGHCMIDNQILLRRKAARHSPGKA